MFKSKRPVTPLLAALICILFLSGCATAPYMAGAPYKSLPDMAGTYHRVEKGDTLWRISRMYGVSLDELTRFNKIADSTSLGVGQRIFIPDQFKGKPEILKYANSEDFIWPVKGRVVASFGQKSGDMVNKGVVIAPYGSLDVAASRSGKVVFFNESFAGLGKTIILDHWDGFFTVYALSSEVFVKPGDSVKKGAVIARLGGTGKSGNLHFEIRKGHLPQNPAFYLP